MQMVLPPHLLLRLPETISETPGPEWSTLPVQVFSSHPRREAAGCLPEPELKPV